MARAMIAGWLVMLTACGLDASREEELFEPQWEACDTGDCSALLLGIEFIDTKCGVAVGGTTETGPAVILQTFDGGATWDPVEVDASGRLYDVAFVDDALGYAVGFDVMLRTRDGGKTWSTVTLPASAWLASVDFATEEIGFAVGGAGSLPIAWTTADGGESWTSAVDRLPEDLGSSLRHVSFLDQDHGFILGQDGVLLETVDRGLTWVARDSGSSAWLRSFCYSRNRYYVTTSTGLLTCWDRGGNWSEVAAIGQRKLNDVLFVGGDHHGSLGWVTTFDGEVLESSDDGETWETVLRHNGTATWFSVRDGCRAFFVADGGRIYQRQIAYTNAAPVASTSLGHASRRLTIDGWTKSEVVDHFGSNFISRNMFLEKPLNTNTEVPGGADQQLTYRANMGQLDIYLDGDRVVLAVEGWSDY